MCCVFIEASANIAVQEPHGVPRVLYPTRFIPRSLPGGARIRRFQGASYIVPGSHPQKSELRDIQSVIELLFKVIHECAHKELILLRQFGHELRMPRFKCVCMYT